jgi:hypothetical protein
MCRNIKTLFNYAPTASDAEIRAAALQYVRKVSGFTKPSQANQAVFDEAVAQIAAVTTSLLDTLVTRAPQRSREVETARARQRAARRFGSGLDVR